MFFNANYHVSLHATISTNSGPPYNCTVHLIISIITFTIMLSIEPLHSVIVSTFTNVMNLNDCYFYEPTT